MKNVFYHKVKIKNYFFGEKNNWIIDFYTREIECCHNVEINKRSCIYETVSHKEWINFIENEDLINDDIRYVKIDNIQYWIDRKVYNINDNVMEYYLNKVDHVEEDKESYEKAKEEMEKFKNKKKIIDTWVIKNNKKWYEFWK